MLAEGTLGAVQRVEGRFDVPLRPARGWRAVADPAEGPGVLLDLGAHLVDQAVLLLGPPVRVYAELAARAPGAVADDDAFLALTGASGTVAHLWLSRSTSAPGPRFRVVGLDATLTVDAPEDKDDPLRLAAVRLEGRLGGLAVDAAVRPRRPSTSASTPASATPCSRAARCPSTRTTPSARPGSSTPPARARPPRASSRSWRTSRHGRLLNAGFGDPGPGTLAWRDGGSPTRPGALGSQPGNAPALGPVDSPGGRECHAAQAKTRSPGT